MEYLKICNAVENALKNERVSQREIDAFINKYYYELIDASKESIIRLWNNK